MAQTETKKTKTLEQILAEFEPLNKVVFKPIQVEPQRAAQPLLPPTFTTTSHPFDYFALFFTHDLLELITKHTNQYAAIQRTQREEVQAQRDWFDLAVEELYVFIGAIIYMGIHAEPNIPLYWNSDPNKGPIHTIKSHISLTRFQQIKRYCHISNSQSDKVAGLDLPTNKRWWYKLEPLSSSLQASFQQYYSPSSEVSIDEIMVRCFGRLVTPLYLNN
jgi:Transposase IS4